MRAVARRAAATGAVLALTTLGALAPSSAAPAPPGSPSHVAALLALRTGATGSVDLLDPATMTSSATQTLTAGKSCELLVGGRSLLGFAARPADFGVGYASGGVGVRERATASGVSCAAVDSSAGESLVVSVGRDASGTRKLVASSASLDIDLKQNASITATAQLAGVTVGTFRLVSGTAAGTSLPATTQSCNLVSDSGPDSGTNDHCRWQINAPTWTGGTKSIIGFDALVLTSDSGSFSLEGGGDGPVDDPAHPMPASFGDYRSASVFELVPTLDCGQTSATASSDTVSSTWKRLGNLDGGPCVAYPYWNTTGVDAEGSYAHFQKPLQLETDAQALWTTSFVYSGPVPTPRITFESLDAAGRVVETTQTLAPCPTGFVPGTTAPPSAMYACVATTSKTTVKGVKTVTFGVYVAGDAWLRV